MTSYWTATGGPALAVPALTADTGCDVAIIGGGYTGLATANELSTRDVDVLLLEARDIGWGASGRNGGSVTPRYKMAFCALEKSYGMETAQRLHGLLHGGVLAIKENVQRFDISCDYGECGQMTAAHSAAALKLLSEDVAWLQRMGDQTPRIVSPGETAERLGLDYYHGAYLDSRGARVHPLKYARGLALGLMKRGVRIHAQTPVVAIRRENGQFLLNTSGGTTVRAKQVVLATDAYLAAELGLTWFRRHFLTVASALITTAPLSAHARQTIVPGRHVVADTFALLNYFQMLPDGSLLFGGRGKVTRWEDDSAVYALLEKRMRSFFPAVGDTPVTHRWSGLVGLSQDNLPHAATIESGLHVAFGYGGRGVVLSHVLGQALCAMVLGESLERFGPLAGVMPAPFRFHGLKRRMIGWAMRYFALRDRIQASR